MRDSAFGSRFPLVCNLVLFCLCAALAFARNINALFYHFDGSYMLVDMRRQLSWWHNPLDFTNNLLQSTGDIQAVQNARLLFFLWPLGWFSDLHIAKVAVYVIVAAMLFLSGYVCARLLSQPRGVALTAGWLLGVLTTPFVGMPFFYPILHIAPGDTLLVVLPVAAFAALLRIGRDNTLSDATSALCLAGLLLYVLAANPLVVPLIVPGTLLYILLALARARTRAEVVRKVGAVVAVLALAVALRWPWYLVGLFADSAPAFFPRDFSAVYSSSIYVSILFQGTVFGWAGPLFVVLAAAGAGLALLRGMAELRPAAWSVIAIIALAICGQDVFAVFPNWILPPPIYFEITIWPLYAVFGALALFELISAIGRPARSLLTQGKTTGVEWIVTAAAAAVTAILVTSKPPTSVGFPFPPKESALVSILQNSIGLDKRESFRGRVATIIPVPDGKGDPWMLQVSQFFEFADMFGNDETAIGLWYYGIPTLFEYNQFMSPAFHALVKRALQVPRLRHQRNVTVLTHPDVRILQLLGVRYVIAPQADDSIGRLRGSENVAGVRWDLLELSDPNIATFAPTHVAVVGSLAGTLAFDMDPRVDLRRSAVAERPVDGDLVSLQSSSLSVEGSDLHIIAKSGGRSLVVLPLEFSNCLELRERRTGRPGSVAEMLRVDGDLTGVVFEHDLDAVAAFRMGPLDHTLCRWRDYRETQAMLHQPGALDESRIGPAGGDELRAPFLAVRGEVVVDGPTGSAITVKPSETLAFSGWAVDARKRTPCAQAELIVDDRLVFPAKYGVARPDVAAYFRDPVLTNVGYTISIPAEALGAGIHHAYVACTGPSGSKFRNPTDFSITVGS